MGANGLKIGGHDLEGELGLNLKPTVDRHDILLERAEDKHLAPRVGSCPVCRFPEVALFMTDVRACAESTGASGMPSKTGEMVDEGFRCTLCEIGADPNARAVAIYSGFVWFLIARSESEDQAHINRSLWCAARQQLHGWREQSRAHLRAVLAKAPGEKGYDEASVGIRDDGRVHAETRLKELLGTQGYMSQEGYKQNALLGTIGIHEIMLKVEQGMIPRPHWWNMSRYFLTTTGMDRLASGLPLGRQTAQNPLKAP